MSIVALSGKLKKALKVMLIGLLALVLLLIALLSWVIFSESGTRQLFSTLARYQLLSYQSLHGSISKQLTIQQLSIHTTSVEVNISDLSLAADWSELLYSKVQLQELSAEQVDINLLSTDTEVSQDKSLNLDFFDNRLVFIPLEVQLQQLSVQQLNINQGEQQFALQDIQLTSLINQQGISATRLSLRHEKTRLQLQGALALAPRLAVDMKLNWTSVLPDSSPLAGTAQISGNAKQLSIQHSSSGSLVSQLRVDLSNWREKPRLALQGTVAKLAWPLTSTAPPQLNEIIFNAQGDLTALHVNASAQLRLDKHRHSRLELISLIGKDKLDISKLRITDNRGGSADIAGQLSWHDNQPSWQTQITLQQFDGSALHPLLPQKLLGSLSIDGSYNNSLTLNVATKNLQGELRERYFDSHIEAKILGDKLQIQHLNARVGDNQLVLSGQLDKSSFNMRFETQFADLKQILPSIKGSIQASGTLTGSPQRPTLKARGEALQLDLYGFSASDISLAVELLEGVLVPDANHLTASNLNYQAMQFESLKIIAQGHWQAPSLWLETISSRLQVNLQTSLQLTDSKLIAGQLKQLRLQDKAIGDWQLEQPVNYRIATPDWSFTELCLQDNGGNACVQASSAGGQLQASLQARHIPLSLLNATALLETTISGKLDIEASVTGDLKGNQGQLRISQSSAETPVVLTTDGDTMQIRIDDLSSQSILNNGTLRGAFSARLNDTGQLSSEFEVAQLLSEHSPLKAQLDYKIPDLKPYALLIPEIDDLSGQLEGTVKFSNSLQKPQLWLFTRLQVPHVYISPLAIEWRNLNAEITTASGSRQDIKASVDAGDGQLTLAGALTFVSASNWHSKLYLAGDNALLMDQANRRVIASPDMTVTATADSLDVEGVLLIPEALLKIKPSPNRLSLTSDAVIHSEQEATAPTRPPYRINMDLAVILGNKVNFEAYGLNTGVTGKLVLTQQSPGSLLGHGELNLINGAYQAYGQDLTIERGIVSFSGVLSRPDIALTANRTIKDVKAGLHVNGPVDNLRTRLYSEPSLPDSEILSYIIRGKPLRDANAAEQNALANALLSYSISQATPVTSKLTELTGLDEIGLEAEEGVETLGFTLGKYITPRLYARYGIGVIDKLSRVFLQYQLSDKLYLETESGVGQSVDLMYRSR